MPNAARCFWTERAVSASGLIAYGGLLYRPVQPLPAGARVTVIEARGGWLLFEHGDQTHAARLAANPGSAGADGVRPDGEAA